MTQLATVVEASDRAAATSSRSAKRDALAACLRAVAPEDVEIAAAFLSGTIRQGRLGIAHATFGRMRSVAAAATPSLTLAAVDATFARIAAATGKGSASRRVELLGALFSDATPAEQRFLMRLLAGELRQGASEGVMVEAIAAAAGVPVELVRRAAMLAGDLGVVARAALAEAAAGLARYTVRPLAPIAPMLAQSAADVADALARLGMAALEFKLDGARVQVHKVGADVRVFTRQLNDVTAAVPEIVEAVRALPARELILDGEAIALAPDGAPQPFQITMRRFGRKRDVEATRAALPLAVFFFDCLYRDGQPLIDRPTAERAAALGEAVPAPLVVPRLVTGDPAAAQAFYAEALTRRHEGVLAKALDAPYEAGNRGATWLKVKRKHTLDLVVLAAEWGHGRRHGWLSNLHLGARDPHVGGFVMLGKTFKGMTDQLLGWQTRELLAREIARDGFTVYVRPELVVEIAFDGLQASPQYPGGVALRFARVKRYRPDKRADAADTIDTVRALFAAQSARIEA